MLQSLPASHTIYQKVFGLFSFAGKEWNKEQVQQKAMLVKENQSISIHGNLINTN